MSLLVLRRVLPPLAAAAVAAAVAVGLTAAPGLADQVRDHEWWLAAVHVTRVWPISRGAGITVAVLDTGVDPAQPDLAASVTTGPDYTHSGRQVGGTYWGVRGTGLAALIAGRGHGAGQAEGIVGVAPGARILSIRVTLEELDPLWGDTTLAARLPAAIAAGIRYAVRHGAKVIELPLDPGAPYADGTAGAAVAAGGSAAERKAVSYALSKGAVLVAPAGDDGPGSPQVNYPAAYPGVISVGAFDKAFTKARFSSRRSYVTLTAPGEGVITTAAGGGYATANGTSEASAIVAGMAALIRARYPGLTPQQVGQALIRGTRYRPMGGRRDGSGYGTADAARAMSAAARLQPVAPLASSPASPSATSAGHPAPGGRTALLRDALIGGAALLLVFSLVMTVRRGRRRKHAVGKPPYGPAPSKPLSAQSAPPDGGTPPAAIPWQMAGPEPVRPQLAPAPKLATPRRARTDEGPPWEPAAQPASEPSWGAVESATSSNGTPGGIAHPAAEVNGGDAAGWRTDHGAAGLPVQRDPASRPVGAAPLGAEADAVPLGRATAKEALGPGWPYGADAPAGAVTPQASAAPSGHSPPPVLEPSGGAGHPSPLPGATGHASPPRDPGGRTSPPFTTQPSPPPDAAHYPRPPALDTRLPVENGRPAVADRAATESRPPGETGTVPGERGTKIGYVWNPGAKTEDFPAVSRAAERPLADGTPQPGRGLHPGDPQWQPPQQPTAAQAPAEPAGYADRGVAADSPLTAPVRSPANPVPSAAFQIIPLADADAYPDDDEDDRHL